MDIVIGMVGGLGNQMFRYAIGRYMSHCGKDVFYNIDWYNKHKKGRGIRKYLLSYFNVALKISTHSPNYNPSYPGAWEKIEYADNIKEILQKEFTVRGKHRTANYYDFKKLIKKDSVGIHIRRGDLLDLSDVNVLSVDYYKKAYEKFGGDVFVFSDDIAWCRKVLDFPDMTFVDIEDYLCFELLKMCPNKIMANSTFSWWAAYLGGGNVIYPIQKKYKRGTRHFHLGGDELIPESLKWIRI